MRRLLAPGIAWIVLLCGADSAGAGWSEPSAGSLNADTAQPADSASTTTAGGTPYVGWNESDGTRYQIRVKRLEGAAWTPVGGSLNVSTGRDAYYPSLASVGDVPYAAWEETDGSHSQIRVKRLESGSWTAVGDSLNVDVARDAEHASIADIGGVPYVAWSEYNGAHELIHVKRLEGAAWVTVGAALNVSTSEDARYPSITSVAGVPYAAWSEDDGTAAQVRVARLEGSAWTPVGGSLNVSGTVDADGPRITGIGGVPHVAWPEGNGATRHLRVKRLDGSTWTAVGGAVETAPGTYPSSPSIADAGGRVVLAWDQYDGSVYHVYAGRFDGTTWLAIGGVLNAAAERDANRPSVTIIGGVPYLAWDEHDSANNQQIHVRRLEPDILGASATTSTTGATLSAQVDDFGLPLPLAFEYGTSAAFGAATPLQTTAGAGASTVTQDIGGLTPATTYSYRAFGSDGVRQTSLGPTQTFMTLAVAPAPVAQITNLALTPAAFVAAGSGPAVAAAARGTRIGYDISAAATTTFTVQRPTVGRKKGAGCVRARRRPPKAKRCTRYVRVGAFTHADVAGKSRFRFTGRVGGRKLKPGAYRLRAVPRNSAGAGRAVTKRFRVKRR